MYRFVFVCIMIIILFSLLLLKEIWWCCWWLLIVALYLFGEEVDCCIVCCWITDCRISFERYPQWHYHKVIPQLFCLMGLPQLNIHHLVHGGPAFVAATNTVKVTERLHWLPALLLHHKRLSDFAFTAAILITRSINICILRVNPQISQ